MASAAGGGGLFATACLALLLLQPVLGARPQPASPALSKRVGGDFVNERPVIGILSQPGAPAPKGSSYIAASYVKWIEAAGARVVPIMYDMTERELKDRFRGINGLLLPGGGAALRPGHPFFDAASSLVRMALEANDAGDYFPVHGTCLGLEALSIIISRNTSLLSDMDAEDAPAPLLYTDEAKDSRFLRALPPHVVDNLQNQPPLAMENHAHGVLMTSYEEEANRRLKDFFKVLSLSLARDGLPYISTMEARKYPITATQWHPEKNQFEWNTLLHIPHSPEAVEVGQEVANFFVSEARRNRHAVADSLQQDMLIYNWRPDYTGRTESGEEEQDFEQVYVFGPPGDRMAQAPARGGGRRRKGGARGARAAPSSSPSWIRRTLGL